jgi:endogenous inhibitor of DNA gyrase (YacG/DUF329 family)
MAADNVVKLKPTRPCPICGKPSAQATHPFCSARCADIDLNRWLSGAYVIPGDKASDDADETENDATTLPAADDEDY